MPAYANNGGDSGVSSYEYGEDWIEVEFAKGKYRYYMYTYGSTGQIHIEVMKGLADRGQGLNSYIGSTVKSDFFSKR